MRALIPIIFLLKTVQILGCTIDDITYNEPGHFVLIPYMDSEDWRTKMLINENGEKDVQFVIDTLRRFLRMSSYEMSQAWKEHRLDYRGEVKYNTLSKPYCFVKQLHADQ